MLKSHSDKYFVFVFSWLTFPNSQESRSCYLTAIHNSLLVSPRAGNSILLLMMHGSFLLVRGLGFKQRTVKSLSLIQYPPTFHNWKDVWNTRVLTVSVRSLSTWVQIAESCLICSMLYPRILPLPVVHLCKSQCGFCYFSSVYVGKTHSVWLQVKIWLNSHHRWNSRQRAA